MITRKPEWYISLHGYLSSVARREFKPGTFDCALFVAGAVEAMTGENLAPKVGKYRTIKGGIKQLKKIGFNDHVAVVEKYFKRIDTAFLHPGDIAVVPAETGTALGIVQGHVIYVLSPDGYLGIVPLTDAKFGFRIPYRVKE